MSLLQLHDRRVVVELDEFCKGSSLRANSDLADVWRLKDGVLNYVNYMHKIWPLEPGPQIIYRVLDDSRWAAVAGDDKKLRANMIRQFFNEAVEVNAGKAVVRAMCLTHQEAKARWVQLVEREFPHTSAMAIGARNGGGGSAARNNGGANKKAGRGAAQPQGSAGGSTGQGTGGGSGGGGQQQARRQRFFYTDPQVQWDVSMLELQQGRLHEAGPLRHGLQGPKHIQHFRPRMQFLGPGGQAALLWYP